MTPARSVLRITLFNTPNAAGNTAVHLLAHSCVFVESGEV